MKISMALAHIVLSASLTLLTYRISSSRKRRKQIQILRRLQGDLIGELPDCVLISILTRLPVKDAIRTSVLSKRWTGLYKFVVHLNLHCHHLGNHCIFDMVQGYLYRHYNIDISFITRCLFNSIDIPRISSKYFNSRRGSKIHSLVFCSCLTKSYHFQYMGGLWPFFKYLGNTAHVEKLPPEPCAFLFSWRHFLSCMPGLRYLEFKSTITWEYLPKSHTNMSLRNLRLSKVTLLDRALDLILSGCLGLCSLRMDHCKFPCCRLHISGPNLRLEHLNIEECSRVRQIKLRASNLVTFEFQSRKVVKLIFDHVPRLQSMYCDGFQPDVMHHVCVRLPSGLPINQLKSLALATKYDIYLLSRTAYTSMLLGIIPLLQSCPLLLEFHLDTEFVEGDGPKAMRPQTPETHFQLKKVEITGFCGSRNEIDFALYILENAICLEQMQISRCPKWRIGFDSDRWIKHEDKPRWSQQTRENICKQLQGRSLSETARVNRLVKGRTLDKLEFLQWLKRYCNSVNGGLVNEFPRHYNPVGCRTKGGKETGIKIWKTSITKKVIPAFTQLTAAFFSLTQQHNPSSSSFAFSSGGQSNADESHRPVIPNFPGLIKGDRVSELSYEIFSAVDSCISNSGRARVAYEARPELLMKLSTAENIYIIGVDRSTRVLATVQAVGSFAWIHFLHVVQGTFQPLGRFPQTYVQYTNADALPHRKVH
ncbi:FBD-associated F-box protein [Striga asiatica]|uniref:FBD-associated F-box protein n=1 Tax=Striga asiatica TaxID=4170 RepID=A0A5A7P1W4_STRAF|nr:FBD-associated F-box protein [Striga asiatica]